MAGDNNDEGGVNGESEKGIVVEIKPIGGNGAEEGAEGDEKQNKGTLEGNYIAKLKINAV